MPAAVPYCGHTASRPAGLPEGSQGPEYDGHPCSWEGVLGRWSRRLVHPSSRSQSMPRKHSPKDEDPIDVLVTVEDRYRDTLPEVSRRLQSAGLTEEGLFELSGVIAGKA